VFIVNTILFVVVGVVMLGRSIATGLTPLALIISGGFIAFGSYRLWLIRQYLKQEHRRS
jgi:hypothetical protein